MRYILIFLVIILSGFSLTNQEKVSWEQKYNEIKKERDYYKKTSEELLKNWKVCEEKLNNMK